MIMIRKFIFLFVALTCFFTTSAQEEESYEKSKEAVEYSNYIVNQQSMMMKRLVDYIVNSIHNDNFEQVEDKRQGVLFQIDLSLHNLEKLKPLADGDEMREKAVEIFKLYKKLYEEDYEEINLLKQTKESSFENMELYFQASSNAELKVSGAFDDLNKAQIEFAEKHKFTIEESEGDETMGIIANVNKYSRDVFLEYFKVYKLSAAFISVTASLDSTKAEENGLELMKGAEDAYTNLKKIEAYKDDENYKSKAIAYVAYNKIFSEKDIPVIMNILKKSEPTQTDIDSLNEILTQYYDDTNELLNQFNNANIKLMRTHIPKMTTQVGKKG
jgi:hypothetical protein